MNKQTMRRLIFLGALLLTALLLEACGAKGPLEQAIKIPMLSQNQTEPENQTIPAMAINGLYQNIGGESSDLGQPVSTDLEDAGNGWKMWHYGCGRIYSNSKGGTFEVYGPIMNEWLALGGGEGPIGYPTGHPQDAFNGKGKSQSFQHALLLWQGSGSVQIISSLPNLDSIEKAIIGLRR